MHWALQALGVDADADERAVKRAYAARLKTVRPDVDPEGFQQLHEAYQAALQWLRMRAEEDRDEGHDEHADERAGRDRYAYRDTRASPMRDDADRTPALAAMDRSAAHDANDAEAPASQASDAAVFDDNDRVESNAPVIDGYAWTRQPQASDASGSDAHASDDTHASVARASATPAREAEEDEASRFDPESFLRDCIGLAVHHEREALEGWLRAQPALWSIERKAQIGNWLLHWLSRERPPMPAASFDALGEFFGFGDLQSGHDAHMLLRMRHRMQLSWELRSGQLRALAARAGVDGGSEAANLRQTRRMLAQLTQPLRWRQALSAGLVPRYPTALRLFLHRLDYGMLDTLPPPIEPAQVAFWDAAADRDRVSLPRLAIGAARCVAYALIASALIAFALLNKDEALDALGMAVTAGTLLLMFTTAWLCWVGMQWSLRWQSRPEDDDEPRPWLRRAMIPTLVALACALRYGAGFGLLGGLCLGTAFALAWARYSSRNGSPLRRVPILNRLSLTHWLIWLPLLLAIIFIPDAAFDLIVIYLFPSTAVAAVALWAADLRRQRRGD